MPAMFVIHERKLKATHSEMMVVVGQHLPYLVSRTVAVPLVTDDEKGFTEAVDHHLPNVRRLLCWKHSINAAKAWLRKHGATASEVPVYISHLRELFHQQTSEQYCDCLDELKVNWSEAFLTYYMEELDDKVLQSHNNYITIIHFVVGSQVSVSLESGAIQPV